MTRPASSFRRATAVLVVVAIAAAVWLGWRSLRPRVWESVELHEPARVFEPWPGDPRCVVDPVVGHRPRSGTTWTSPPDPSTDAAGSGTALGVTGPYGLISSTPHPATVTGPRVLLVGDEQLADAGTALCDELTALLRRAPRGQLDRATVLDAACPSYSLYQLALRVRTLVGAVDPELVVAVVNTVNDLDELLDPTRPHLDRNGFEVPAQPRGRPAADAARDALGTRARRAIELLADATRRGGATLLVAVLPAADRTGAAPRGDSRDPVLELCRQIHVAHVDLLPVLSELGDGAPPFRPDGLLSDAGQAAVARALAPRITRILRLR